jgi:hypothetical protein
LTFAKAKPFRKSVHLLTFAIEGTLGDQRQRAGNRVARPAP